MKEREGRTDRCRREERYGREGKVREEEENDEEKLKEDDAKSMSRKKIMRRKSEYEGHNGTGKSEVCKNNDGGDLRLEETRQMGANQVKAAWLPASVWFCRNN